MTAMTHISDAAVAAREQARVSGRFGHQEHTAPQPLSPISPSDRAMQLALAGFEVRRQVDDARIRLAASRMPESISGVVFARANGKLVALTLLPTDESVRIPSSDALAFTPEVQELVARAEGNPQALQLSSLNDGRYVWAPDAEDRDATDAEDDFNALVSEYRELVFEQDTATLEALSDSVPQGFTSVEVCAEDDRGPKRPVAAVNPAGERVEISARDADWDAFRDDLTTNIDPARLGPLTTRNATDTPQWTFQPTQRRLSIFELMGDQPRQPQQQPRPNRFAAMLGGE